jgi:hypothetical protein
VEHDKVIEIIKIQSNILLSRLSPYMDDIIEDYQFTFWRNRSPNDQIFCIRQMLKKNMGIQ